MKLRKLIIPGLLGLLLLLLASASVQAYSGYYYVVPSSVSLRECASMQCAPLLTVYQGEKVKILERTTTGWSQVSLVERAAMGWLPNDMLTYRPGTAPEHLPPYYVNRNNIALHDKPNPHAKVLTTLNFNDPVEMLGVGTSGWAQVRDLRTSLVGYLPPRYLSKTPASHYKSSPRRRAPARKQAPEEEEAPEKAPKETPKEAPGAPHSM